MSVKRNSWGRRWCQLPLMVAVAAIVAWSSYHHTHHKYPIEDSHHRSLSTLSDFIDPKSTSPHVMVDKSFNGNDVTIHMYIKTTGRRPWFNRVERIADTWGKEVAANIGKITFLIDNNNQAEVDEFFHQRPWTIVKHIEGTDNGRYKGRGITHAAKLDAHRGQRLKTRAVFADYLDNPEKPDWICYMDDDMIVNISNLKMDLLENEPECSPNCMIADRRAWRGISYTAGGWCMQQNLAQRAAELLHDKTDDELNWTLTDDVDFNQMVIQKGLGATATGSDRWHSEFANEGKQLKWGDRGMWQDKTKFRETIGHNLAVYHIGYC